MLWPIRGKIHRLIDFVGRSQPEGSASLALTDYGEGLAAYGELVDKTLAALEQQHVQMQENQRRLENFSRVLEKHSRKVSESRQRYRRTLDALDNGLYLVDEDYVIRSINLAEAAYFDAHPRDLVGRRCYEVFRNRTNPCSDCLPRECMADGRPRNRQRVAQRRIGREFVNIFCYPIMHEGEDKSREAVIYIQDASSQVAMENQIVRAEKMASIGQMAAGIAHDLNNYLAGIYGGVQVLELRMEQAGGREKELKQLNRLKDQVEALNLLASNLMVFSHPERKKAFPLALNQVIEDALTFSRYELERDQVSVVAHLAPDLPLAMMEKGQIQQVFLNIISNSRE